MTVLDRLRSWLGTDERPSRAPVAESHRPVDAFNSGAPTHSRHEDARLLLLSRFASPCDACGFEKDYWASTLGERVRDTIDRLRADGLLESASVPDALSAVHQARELKEFARARGLKVSGTKAELSLRLAGSDPDGMKRLLAKREILVCSMKGRALADEWTTRVAAAREAVQNQVLELVRARRFADAARAVARFESNQVFSRGLGIAWDQGDDPAGFGPQLSAIFAGVPKILSRAQPDEIEILRVAAAASLLWGDRGEERWLPQGFVSTTGFDNDVAVRMFVFYARHVCEIARMKGIVRTVKVSAVNDHVTCDACRALAGPTYELRRAPELPNSRCTSPMGCRCFLSPEDFGV